MNSELICDNPESKNPSVLNTTYEIQKL